MKKHVIVNAEDEIMKKVFLDKKGEFDHENDHKPNI